MQKKVFGLVLIFLITGSFVFAGGGEEAAEAVDPDAPSGEAVYATDYYGGMPLDPHYSIHGAAATVIHPTNGVANLMQQDPEDASVSPGMALSWEVSSDFKTWTFELREGVVWPKTGNSVTAHDWEYGFDKIRAGEAEAGRTSGHKVIFEDIYAKDDYTLVVKLNDPSVLLGPMSSVYGARGIVNIAIDSKYTEEVGYEKFKQEPSTLGWFLAKERRLGEYAILEAHDTKFDWAEPKQAGVKEIKFLVVPETMTRMAMLQTGQIDVMGKVIGPAVPQAIEDNIRLEASPVAAIRELVLTELKYLDDPHPVHDVRVRKALAHAIDRQAIIDKIYYGYADIPTIPSVASFIPGADPDVPGYPYNPEKSKDLLAEAGYPDGFDYKISSLPIFMDLSLAIQGYFADIGVDLEVIPVEDATYTRSLSEKTIRGIAITPCTVRAEPVVMNAHYYEVGASWSWSMDEELDAMIKDILNTPNDEERYEKQKEYSWMLHEKLPRIGVVGEKYVYGVGPRIDRFVPGIHFVWDHAEWLTLNEE